jgi:hypothetical protein
MSQTMRNFLPQFTLNDQGPTAQFNFDPRASLPSSNGSQQWGRMAPRSAQHSNISSPSASVRSAMTAPAPGFYNPSRNHQPSIGSMDHNIDPSLSSLGARSAPPGHAAQTNYSLERSLHDDPWTALHLRNSTGGDGQMLLPLPNAHYKDSQRGPGSVGSIVAPVSDSGYHSQSVASNDASRLRQSRVSQNVVQQPSSLHVQSRTNSTPAMIRVQSDQRSQTSRISSRSGRQANELQCQECKEVMKTRSELKCVLKPWW